MRGATVIALMEEKEGDLAEKGHKKSPKQVCFGHLSNKLSSCAEREGLD